METFACQWKQIWKNQYTTNNTHNNDSEDYCDWSSDTIPVEQKWKNPLSNNAPSSEPDFIQFFKTKQASEMKNIEDPIHQNKNFPVIIFHFLKFSFLLLPKCL